MQFFHPKKGTDLFFQKGSGWNPEWRCASHYDPSSCQLRASEGQLLWGRRDEKDPQSRIHGFPLRKCRFSHLFFQETYYCLYIWRDKKKGIFYLLPLGILLLGNRYRNRHNLGYKYSQILPDWIGTTHVMRLFQTFQLAFVFLILFLTHPTFSHGKLLLLLINYYYWRCLVNSLKCYLCLSDLSLTG